MRVKILKPGMWSTMQDRGRKDLQDKGIPIGGALDQLSYQMVNALLGNQIDTPVIEITIMGPKIHFDQECYIAICGSDLNPQIEGVSIQMNQVVKVNTNQILSFGRLKHGCRAYIGIAGEWQVEKWLGSVSPLLYGVDMSSQVGILKKEQVFEIIPHVIHSDIHIDYNIDLKSSLIKGYKGPEFEKFNTIELSKFFNAQYKIAPDSNRMGYRLSGEPIKGPTEQLISSATLPGTVQLPNDGNPIILLNDSQTTGGYPRILQLHQESINLLAHKKPGDRVYFKLIGYDD